MEALKGKVAVVTGAGSGIGRELTLACAREGADVVLADVDEAGMAATAALIAPLGCQSMQARCDVSRADEVERLADRTYARFGAAHLVFNNAGVAVVGPVWTATQEDWTWTLGINLMGVVHGIRAFVPRMLAGKQEGHVVNTASVAGFLSMAGNSVYCVSKHAVVTLSECLWHDLQAEKASIGVSVLCPAFVKTGIFDSARNRPSELAATNPLGKAYEEAGRRAIEAGKLSAADVAAITIEAVKAGRFYVLPHAKIKAAIETRMRDILEERDPTDTSRPASSTRKELSQ
jgi:NAD(P)-dependent dehydrogenase (short-subunit alcohol dehydrogenase family)